MRVVSSKQKGKGRESIQAAMVMAVAGAIQSTLAPIPYEHYHP